MSQQLPPLPLGHMVGQYEIVEHRASGGFGHVYKAQHKSRKSKKWTRAIKHLLVDDPQVRQLFEMEAELLIGMHNPHFPTIYDLIIDGTQVFILMEWIEGGTLIEGLVARQIPTQEVADILIKILTALDFLHVRNIIHRDVKPANVMLDWLELVMLIDLGGAQVADENGKIIGLAISTPHYRAPQQIRGMAEPVDDIFAVGATGLSMVTDVTLDPENGRRMILEPYEEVAGPANIDQQLADVEAKGIHPKEFCDVLRKALAYHRHERWQSAPEMIRALEPFASKRPVAPVPVTTGKLPGIVPPPQVSELHETGGKAAGTGFFDQIVKTGAGYQSASGINPLNMSSMVTPLADGTRVRRKRKKR